MSRIYQATISGRDAGGYAWQNVFHVSGDDSGRTEVQMLGALVAYITSNILPAYQAAMNNLCAILDVSARQATASGFTLHNPVNMIGGRGGDPGVGAVCGKIAWYPLTGSAVGHQFIAGSQQTDYPLDQISTTYAGLLADLITVFMAMDGTPATYLWQFGIFNRTTVVLINAAMGTPLGGPGVLSKRVRN